MYIQYETKNGEYYCLDLFEKPLNMLLLSYIWIKPMKLYKADKKYTLDISTKERERRNLLQPFVFALAYFLAKITIFDLDFSLNVSTIGSVFIYLIILFVNTIIVFCFFLHRRKKMNISIVIDKANFIMVSYKPRSKPVKFFLMIICPFLISYLIWFNVKHLSPITDQSIAATICFTLIIVLSPYRTLLTCIPRFNGEVLKKCEL